MSSIKIIYVALLCVVSASFATAELTATKCRDGGNEDDMYYAVDTTIATCRSEISKCTGDPYKIIVSILILESIKLTLYVTIRLLIKVIANLDILDLVISVKISLSVKLLNFLLDLVIELAVLLLGTLIGDIDINVFEKDIDSWCDKYSTSIKSQCNNDADYDNIIEIIIVALSYWANCCKSCLC
ncbi:uncharacterized protein LOC125501437 [Athalia rosae]|uniref:uncharacterized protein LOC125501437 n=1 Tax=Athalia rosae TaxID=37344 RepID=UPI0020345042|nr:uncharacterized protein LOC125501437 [Athalia rosae]XP_048513389.1 uncharacterized protein LOC125501437 [Athalia rosae]